jgi:transcriptional regulator with XRE-family HTH domain
MVAPMAETLRELGSRIRSQREVLGLTQEGLAERMGRHWTYIGQVERGKGVQGLRLVNLLKFADALEIDAGSLIKGLRPPE